jgi:hypothetical protein
MNLSELKFGSEKRPVPHWRSSPTEKMRAAVLTAIQNQRVLLDAERTGTAPNLTKTVKTMGEDGSVITSVVAKNPRKWFWKNQAGLYLIEMLFAGHPVLVNGKQSTILAGDADGVERVLNVLADAVSKGELDTQLASAAANRKKAGKKSA